MKEREPYFKEKVEQIFQDKKNILDIGAGLRIEGNRIDPSREWIKELAEKVNYKVMDPVPDYDPDIVGDIHAMPFEDESLDAIVCLAVLEHVENPIKATQEMYRTLKKGGYCFVYVPFLYYYHAEKGYYGDFWRFTPDSIKYMFRDFSHVEIKPLHGPIETLAKLAGARKVPGMQRFAHWLDTLRGKESKQASGWHVWAVK